MPSSAPRAVGVRRLVVMRHAKAEQLAPSDEERPLAARGLADARAAGEWLRAHGVAPDTVLVSSARRALETWREVAAGAQYAEPPATVDRGLYQAEPDSVLDLVRTTPDDVRTLMVVGHNPTLEMVVLMLDDGAGELDPAAGFPTSALAVLEVGGSWADLGTQGARVAAVHVARA